MNNYIQFLKTKRMRTAANGIDIQDTDTHETLFPFQRDIVKWACRKGRCAIFADTGLGKTIMQVEWARLMGGRCLIIAPLSVARQTIGIAKKVLGIQVTYCRSEKELTDGINITNYEMIDHFIESRFDSVVLDESSILKSISGVTRRKLIKQFQNIKYRICCTATPAPNDLAELGNHAEFLGICTTAEMRAMFFVNANKETYTVIDGHSIRKKGSNKGGTEWRLKHPAEEPFYEWLATWGMAIIKPSDLGDDDARFELPPLNIHPIFIQCDYVPPGALFFTGLKGIQSRHEVRKRTIDNKIQALKDLVFEDDAQWIIWAGLDDEARKAAALGNGEAVEVSGRDTAEAKAHAFEDFQDGKFRCLITKPKIGGFGMNFQNAHKMVFVGLTDSWESWYQCIRRQWRYGQKHPVDVYVILTNAEQEILHNVNRKDALAKRLRTNLISHIRDHVKKEIGMEPKKAIDTGTVKVKEGVGYKAYQGDSCTVIDNLKTDSVDLSVYSPPFADLYTYTDSEKDLGNSRNWDEFFSHYAYIIRNILRVTKPGRLTCVHTSDIPAMLQKDGYIGIKDFPGAVIQAYEKEGWIFCGRAFVQKNPQAQAIRTKSKGLLFVQLRKDSTDSRPALVDQILLFKKPGDNAVPINPVGNKEMDNETWIEWANGIWIGISESNTLQFTRARAADDEKHICPLQLPVIERCIKLYSNPGETVLSPFMGIGSEGYVALKFNRKFIGIELKESYFKVAVSNLNKVVSENKSLLFKDKAIE